MTAPLTISIAISDEEAKLLDDGRSVAVIPISDAETEFLGWAINAQASFITRARKVFGDLDLENEPELRAFVHAATEADKVSDAIRAIIGRAIFVAGKREVVQ
jgi:hypothetical protein